jgi:HAD superfamily hydrolase (TIGR01450 family)
MTTLAGARGFMFDLDGTLVQRSRTGTTVIPGASGVLGSIRESGRPLVVFTNASHVAPARIAEGIRDAGLDIGDDEVLTPVCSALSHLARRHPRARVLVIGTDVAKERILARGVDLVADNEAAHADVVFVAHTDEVELSVLEGAAHAVLSGAAFLTGNYARAYAGAEGPVLSRGAMVTAAIAKAAGRRPTVVGKPSRAAVREVSERLGVDSREVAVVGDDIGMDIALGRIGGSLTVLVRSGITGGGLDGVPENRRPDLVVDGVADLIPLL